MGWQEMAPLEKGKSRTKAWAIRKDLWKLKSRILTAILFYLLTQCCSKNGDVQLRGLRTPKRGYQPEWHEIQSLGV